MLILTSCDFITPERSRNNGNTEFTDLKRKAWNPKNQRFKGEKPEYYYVMGTLSNSTHPDSAYIMRAYTLEVPDEAKNLEKTLVSLTFVMNASPETALKDENGNTIFRTVNAVIPDHPGALGWLRHHIMELQANEWQPKDEIVSYKNGDNEAQGYFDVYYKCGPHQSICSVKIIEYDNIEIYIKYNCVQFPCEAITFYVEDTNLMSYNDNYTNVDDPCMEPSYMASLICGNKEPKIDDLGTPDEYEAPCPGDVIASTRLVPPHGSSSIEAARFKPCIGNNCDDGTSAVRKNKNGTPRAHFGIDLACSPGELIFAPFDLTNVVAGQQLNEYGRGYGNFVRGNATINGEVVNIGFAHLAKVPDFSGNVNVIIEQGSPIGICGRSGITNDKNPTHVHIETIKNGGKAFVKIDQGKAVNPESLLSTKFGADGTPINPNPCKP